MQRRLPVEIRTQVVGQFRRKLDYFLACRVLKCQAVGMKELA